MGCCSSSTPNKSDNKDRMKHAPKAGMPMGMTPEQRMQAMRDFVTVSEKKAEEILNMSSKTPEEIMKSLTSIQDLLRVIRDEARFEATGKLEAVFNAFDDQPADGKLSILESNAFIRAYFECMENFIAKLYRVGLELVEPENKSKHADSTRRVVDLFKNKREELIQMWHENCDRNRDGQLQLLEVKEAFLGNGAGDAEKKLAVFLDQELHELLFTEQV